MPKIFPSKILGYGAIYEKVPFFMDLIVRTPKTVSGSCTHNFDATDLPRSLFEPLYPKLFGGNPEVDLVSTVWPPDLPKVR